MTDTELKKWYVVRAVSGQENKIRSYMDSEINRLGFSDQVEEILVPTQKVIQIRKGKKISKEKVYFPGYIMIKANLSGEIPHIIKSLTNVIGFLGETKGGDPIPLRTAEVNRMLGKVDELSSETESISASFSTRLPSSSVPETNVTELVSEKSPPNNVTVLTPSIVASVKSSIVNSEKS